MTTVGSPRGLLMIGLSFWTGLLTAYFLCATGRVNVTLQPFSVAFRPFLESPARSTSNEHPHQDRVRHAQSPRQEVPSLTDVARRENKGRSQARGEGAVVFE